MAEPIENRAELFEEAFKPLETKAQELQKDLPMGLDLKSFLEYGYILIRREQLEKTLGEEPIAKMIENYETFKKGMCDWLDQPYEVKKPFAGKVVDYCDEVKLWCPGYWDRAAYVNIDRYQEARDESLEFPQETYESGDLSTTPIDDCLRPYSDTAESLDVSTLPHKAAGELAVFVHQSFAQPLFDACAKLFCKEDLGDVAFQTGCNYYTGPSKYLASHCDGGFLTTMFGPNKELEGFNPVTAAWEVPSLEAGDLLLFAAVQYRKAFNISTPVLCPALPHRVPAFESGRFSSTINHFYKPLTAQQP